MSLQLFFNTTLPNIYETISATSLKSSIKLFSSQHADDLPFLSEIICNNNGYFALSDFICHCDFCFFGTHCTYPGSHYWKDGWKWFRAVFGISYGLLALLTWYYFIIKIKNEENCLKRLQRIFFTPKYLIIINLIAISNSKHSLHITCILILGQPGLSS